MSGGSALYPAGAAEKTEGDTTVSLNGNPICYSATRKMQEVSGIRMEECRS